MTYLTKELEELKTQAITLFSDAISVRNPDREDFLKAFVIMNRDLKNSVEEIEFFTK